jgi:hypothetical protein
MRAGHNRNSCGPELSLWEVERRKGPRPRSQVALAKHILDRAVASSDGCLLWPGAQTKGYGMVMARAWHPTSPQQVHRVVYEVVKGPVPAGSEVSHLCAVRLCVNPAHLVAESHAANMERIPAERRGRKRRPDPDLSEVGAGGRLTHTVARYLALNPRRRHRYPHELIKARIRRDGGVWGVVVDFGISYSHACRIRAGWRPGAA